MKKLLFSLLVVSLLLPGVGLADGMIVTPAEYYAWETEQKGAIFYESDTKTETLVISMAFQGDATDFAWVIPTPNKPEVEKGSQKLFTELEELTGVDDYKYESGISLGLTADAPMDTAVTVIEEKTVDYYDIAVLASTDSKALSKWLNDNGYQYPKENAYILNDYINNDWYFVAAKITQDAADDSTITSDLNYGTATPLQLTFTAENIVYPLKISKVTEAESADDYLPGYEPSYYVDIDLYVITDHRQELTDFTAEYADKITNDEIEDLAVDTQGDPWVAPAEKSYFLTKLYSYYAIEDMEEDLFPKDAEKDTKIKAGYQWTGEDSAKIVLYTLLFIAIGLIAVIISPWVLLFAFYSLIFYLVKNVKVKITFAVIQIIDMVMSFCMFGAAIALTVFAYLELFSSMETYYYSIEEEISLVAAAMALTVVLGIVFVAKVVAMIIQKKKYKK